MGCTGIGDGEVKASVEPRRPVGPQHHLDPNNQEVYSFQ